jgi:hypothetical protein
MRARVRGFKDVNTLLNASLSVNTVTEMCGWYSSQFCLSMGELTEEYGATHSSAGDDPDLAG